MLCTRRWIDVLLSLGGSAIQRGVRAAQTRSDRRENRPLIRLFHAVNVCYARIFHRLNVRSPCPLPREGAAILVSNHTSGLDPLLIQAVCPRLITWMVAREYYEMPALRWMFRMIGAIPVERGGRDSGATRAALRALESGAVLGVFPEGRIETSRALLPFQPGVALMAIKTRVPVWPVFLDGTQRGSTTMLKPFTFRQSAQVAFGEFLRFDDARGSAAVDAASQAIMDAVQALQITLCKQRISRQ